MKCLLTLTVLLVVGAQQASGARDWVERGTDGSVPQRVLWRDPGPIAQKDLYWGSGDATRVPRPPFTFVKEDTGGTKPKVTVTDANGSTWNVKFGGESPRNNEVHAEIAATRLAWALGYLVEEHYYVGEGVVENAKGLRRAAGSIGTDGRFRVARFERSAPDITRTGRHWSLVGNPFEGTRELSGLKLILALVNTWDTKKSNLSIFQRTRPDGQIEHWYVVSDYGSSFGRMGPFALFATRNRWSLEDYQTATFVKKVGNRSLTVNHKGDISISDVPIDHARWFAQLSSQLSERQVRQGFEAAGASATEIEGFSDRVMGKLRELHEALGVPQQR